MIVIVAITKQMLRKFEGILRVTAITCYGAVKSLMTERFLSQLCQPDRVSRALDPTTSHLLKVEQQTHYFCSKDQ